ncbi:MAG TPA: ATP-dependent zinc metalloprotease FtsH [Niastella sp.]
MLPDNKGEKPPKKERSNKRHTLIGILMVLGMVLLLPLLLKLTGSSVQEISWLEFEEKILNKGAVEKLIIVNQEYAEIYLKPQFKNDTSFSAAFKPLIGKEPNPGPHYLMTIGSLEVFEQKLANAEQKRFGKETIPITYLKKQSGLWGLIGWIIPFGILFILWRYAYRKGNTGDSAFNFGRSTATLFEKENKSTITFDDVAGLDEAELEVKEIVDFLKNPQDFTRLGAKIPKGVILVGPPGTGKTLLAKAVAGEAQVPFFSISGSEFVEMFVGVGASRVRDLFKRAKEKAPSIVFIDEIDAIGRSRSRNAIFSGSNDERESTLNQLLTEMDGFGTNTGVIVLAATNRADMLDPALLRPGRFDRHIYLELPNLKEREAIFKVHIRSLVLDNTIDIQFLATQTPGFSGADIANICNEAALIAARKKKEKIGRSDFLDAVDRIVAGLERKSKIISREEKKIIAYHEAGHAIISWLLPRVDPLVKVSIIPRGKTLGAAWYLPEEKSIRTQSTFNEHLCATLGGRAAEEVIFDEVSSGALDDLEKVTKEAYTMVAYYGFNEKIGSVSFYDSSDNRNGFHKPYSEETGRLIDEEVRKLVNNAYQHAKDLLIQNRQGLVEVAELLLKKEVIFKDDLENILGSRLQNVPNENAITG